jgi:hypothetical protein
MGSSRSSKIPRFQHSQKNLIGEEPEIKARLGCKGLPLNGGLIYAFPELEGQVDGVGMSNEAALGRLAQEEIAYLMS